MNEKISKKTIAFIPVRGGSKSIPLKNIKIIAGKPLVFWVIEAALGCDEIDEVWVSTDNSLIKELVESINNKKLKIHIRSDDSSTDEASTEMVMLEFANNHEFSIIVLIQATSPLLTSFDLTMALHEFKYSNTNSLLSLVRQKRFMWQKIKSNVAPLNYDFYDRPRRQEFEGYLVENGAFYITNKTDLLKSKSRISGDISFYEMDDDSYFEIDEPTDWIIVENLLLKRSSKKTRESNSSIKLFLTDVDGVLTDAGMYYSNNGDEQKKFNTKDGKGFELLRLAGIKTGIITSEITKIVENRALKLKLDHLYQGVTDKLKVATSICKLEGISLDQVAYIGDDINDVELLSEVGLKACPNDAVQNVKQIEGINILNKNGGFGVIREFVDDFILSK